MIALVLVVMISLVAYHWLLEPLLVSLAGPLELQWFPWLALALGGWLLSGDASRRSDKHSDP